MVPMKNIGRCRVSLVSWKFVRYSSSIIIMNQIVPIIKRQRPTRALYWMKVWEIMQIQKVAMSSIPRVQVHVNQESSPSHVPTMPSKKRTLSDLLLIRANESSPYASILRKNQTTEITNSTGIINRRQRRQVPPVIQVWRYVLKQFIGNTNPESMKKTTTQKYPWQKILIGVYRIQGGAVLSPSKTAPES